MADRLPSNLFDDGDIWLPPDIFHNETASNFLPRHHHHHSRFCLDDLAHQFASLLLPNQHQNFPPNREQLPRFPQLNTHVPVFAEPKPPSASHGGNGGAVGVGPIPNGFGNGSFSSGAHPVYVFPSHTQLDRDLETRARILKMQQNRLLRNRVGPHGYGFGIGGGLVRESGGTGVFHPRIVDSSSNATRQGIRNRDAMEIQANEHLNSMTRLDFTRQEDFHHHLLLPSVPEMGLPRSYNQY